MNLRKLPRHALLAVALLSAGSGLLGAVDEAGSSAVPSSSAAAAPADSQIQNEEIARLKAALAEQQKQLNALQQMLQQQQKLLENAAGKMTAQQAEHPNVGNVASLTPYIPEPAPVASPLPAIPTPQAAPAAGSSNPCEAPPETTAVPPYLRLGGVCIQPVGFMDLTAVWRNEDPGSGIGTSFGSIPFNNGASGRLSEFRFSPQNSRLGFRADGNFQGIHVIGYNEFDFLGTSGGNNLGVTNGAFVPRIRLYWVDLRRGGFEFLAGQSWSLLTPNRKGLSPLPGDIFYSQVMDVNYLIGLTWTRQPGIRFVFHPNNNVAAGVALENPDQYMGGSSGGGSTVLPSALTGLAGTQIDNQTNVLATPNLHPDIIGKIAFDFTRVHFEIAGIERTFRIWNPNTNNYFTKAGGGGSLNANIEIIKNLHIISNNFWSDGGGRYLFGQAPDLIIRADGSISPVHSGGFNEGFEATAGKFLIFGYYGGAYIGRDVAVDTNGSLVGYGYKGSANSENRTIQEVTFGFNQTMWRNPRYGAINLIGQYQYAWRNPWFVAVGAPKNAKDNTIYFDIRYTLPGTMPAFN